MKKILTVLCLIINVVVLGQNLGQTSEEIKLQFKESKFELESWIEDNGSETIGIKTPKANITFTLSSNNICISTFITPVNQEALNFYIKKYNDLFVIVSSTKWKMYHNEGIANIDLVQITADNNEKFYAFIWSNE